MRDRPLVVAHRGASAAWPEHTPAAYAEAIAAGADAVECDVRMSSDGHLVCIHDARVDRTSNGRGPVSRHTLAQLRRLDWSAPGPQPPSTVAPGTAPPGTVPPTSHVPPADPAGLLTLPDLVDLLLAAASPVGLLVETKHPVPGGRGVEAAVVAALRPALARLPLVGVMSFWPPAVHRVRRSAPGVTRVALRADRHPAPVLGRPHAVGLAVATVRRDPAGVRRAQAAGRDVYVWTVDEAEDVQRCVAAGVDAIITNRPREVRGMLSP